MRSPYVRPAFVRHGLSRGSRLSVFVTSRRRFGLAARPLLDASKDPRIRHIEREIEDEYAHIREHYDTPKYPIVLAHGLLGFSELRLADHMLPAIKYWFGIKEALSAKGIRVIETTVPPAGTIEQRALMLGREIASQVAHDTTATTDVNIVAHSMGGLDARLMIARHLAPHVRVRSLVTIATPHHGSGFADYLMEQIGPRNLPRAYRLFERATGLDSGAFRQLTTRYAEREFNPHTPDDPAVRYFSYGAAIRGRPPLLSPFRHSHAVLLRREGRNDGLVSLRSSHWGQYKGTLVGVNHLDLINWSNRLSWTIRGWLGQERKFNAIAFYLDIADMLAKEGL